MIEVLVVIVFIGLLVALAGPLAGKLIRRSEDMAALSSARQVLAVARLEAVRRSSNVVVEIGYVSPSDKRIRLHTFQDRANDTRSPLPGSSCVTDPSCASCPPWTVCPPTACPTDEAKAAGNCVQDIGTFATPDPATGIATDELTLGDVSLSPRIHFWKQGGSEDDVADAVHFDTYLDTPGSCNTSCGTSTHRIVFLPTGGISIPQDSGSGPNPASPTTDKRGIYFADWQGKNYFRVTVESNLSGKARVEKYVNEASGYYVPNSDPVKKWRWL